MADLGFAVKEKVTPDHDVIDEAIREEAEVRTGGHDAGGFKLTCLGIHCLFHSRRDCLQTEQRKSKEFEDKRLSWQSAASRCVRPSQCLYGICRLRGEEERCRRCWQGR